MSADVRAVLKALGPGDCFIDGGANVGLFTLPAAVRVGQRGSVLAIEPGKVNRRLVENIALNRLPNVTVVAAALDERDDGQRQFADRDGDAAGLSSFSTEAPADGSTVTVLTRTLDSLAERCRSPIRVVKLDLEGAEVAALKGADNLLTHVKPRFLVEVEDAHLRRHGSSAAELLEIFARKGYRAVASTEPPNVWFEPI